MKAIIKEDKELILEEQNLMLQTENNIEKIDFEFPDMINGHSIEKFRKYIEIETIDGSFIDEIVNDTYIITRALTKYKLIKIQIVLIYEEKDIVFKTTKRRLTFDESINADKELKEEEQSLLYKMSEKVNKLENYDDTKMKEDISNIQQEQTTQNTKISNLEEDNITNKQDISNLQENISDIQQDNINHNTRIEDIENSYVKNDDYATEDKPGIIKVKKFATNISDTGYLLVDTYTEYAYKNVANKNTFIGKGTLENIKDAYVEEGLQNSKTIENINTEIEDIEENYVKNIDYATESKAGIIRASNGLMHTEQRWNFCKKFN